MIMVEQCGRALKYTRAQFTYSNSLRSQQIRLLDLKYGHKEETIQFDLLECSLDDTPNYIALSYTWGDPKNTVPVLCDGKLLNITRNLKEALWQLRRSRVALTRQIFPGKSLSRPLYFWIDAVCINQSDNQEKSCQVRQMADIYRKACKTIVWLGPADENSDSIMDYLNAVGKEAAACGMDMGVDPFREIWRKMASAPATTYAQNRLNIRIEMPSGKTTVSWKALQALFDSLRGTSDQASLLPLDGIQRLFTRPWWGRIWVLQEITLPENAEILCGTKQITRRRCSAFLNAYYALWHALRCQFSKDPFGAMRHQGKILMAAFHHRPLVMLSSRRLYKFERFPLAALLRLTCVGGKNLRRHGPHHLESTDPRDKIYALLGLAADSEELFQAGVFPDYTKPKEKTYTTTMAALLEQGHLSLLSFCEISKGSSSLPSWVPDWSHSLTHKLQDVENDHITICPQFKASGAEPLHSGIATIRENGIIKRISIRCHIYDRILTVGSFPGRLSSFEVPILDTFSWPIEWLMEIIRLTYLGQRGYSGFGDRIRAAARTSIGGVGFGPDMQLTRVRDERFPDAVSLLRNGFNAIKESPIKSSLHKFLQGKGTQNMAVRAGMTNLGFGSEIIGKSLGRLPCISTKGNLVLCTEQVNRGDLIVLIRGAQVPFILRHQHSRQYCIVGEAYVDGIMDGEAMGCSQWETIELA